MENKDPIEYHIAKSTMGKVLVATSSRGVCALLMGDTDETLIDELVRRFPSAQCRPAGNTFKKLADEVVGLIDQPKKKIEVKLDLRGTDFQQKVWKALCRIPVGKTASYSDIAKAIGSPKAVRAVAGACAANHIALIIPCHRVVRSDGSLSGYRWGEWRKAALLNAEKAR